MPVDPSTGCAIDQLCPCPGPRGTSVEWKNHGEYVTCVTNAAKAFQRAGIISSNQKSAFINAAAQSECGQNPCNGNALKNQSASSAPYLQLEVRSFARTGTATPTSTVIYAGTTRIYANAQGKFIVPLVNSQNKVIDDNLSPNDCQSNASIPKGAFFVLRDEGGKVTLGLKGFFPRNNSVAMEVIAKVMNGKKGGERNVSFEGQGNGFAVLGVASEDEFYREVGQVRVQTTVTTQADLMQVNVCK